MYEEHKPRACQYIVSRQICTITDVRLQLDRLTIDDVLWGPYTEHRAYCPFVSISLFCGYLRGGDATQRHIPKRVLCQFGFVQTIPRPLLPVHPGVLATIEDRWLHFADHVIRGLTLHLNQIIVHLITGASLDACPIQILLLGLILRLLVIVDAVVLKMEVHHHHHCHHLSRTMLTL